MRENRPVLNQDPKLPFLEMAWSPNRMAEFFNQRVTPRLRPGAEVTTVSIEDMTYKPGRECVILYTVGFAGPSKHPHRLAVVTFAKDDKLHERYTAALGGNPNGSAVFLPEHRCLVEFFPTDWKLPYLARANDGEEIALLLSQFGTAALGALSGSQLKPNVLQYRPHQRCVLRYTQGSVEAGDSKDAVGKFYPQGPKASRAWHAHNALHAQATAGVIIPKPLRLVNDWNLVLMECISGTPLKQVLEDGSAGPETALEVTRAIAAALASLHRMNYPSGEVRTFESLLQLFRERAADLHLVAPALARQVDSLLSRIEELTHRRHSDIRCCIHGECKASQFLTDHGRVAIVDFDRICLGDPAVDVGHFMAGLHRMAVHGRENLRDLASHFLTAYQECLPQDGLEERARLFQAASLVRMAVRSFTRSPYAYGKSGADSLPALLLQEAAACLPVL